MKTTLSTAMTAFVVAAILGCCPEKDPTNLIRVPAGGDVAAAVAKARTMRAAGMPHVEIRLARGVHRIAKPIRLEPVDSGLSFTGEKGAVVSGAVALPTFTAASDGVWQTDVPDGLVFEQLWVNGTRAQRAKSPNEFYHYILNPAFEADDPDTGKPLNLNRRGFYGDPKDLAPLAKLSREELGDVVFRAFYGWDSDWGHVHSVDAKTGLVILKATAGRNFFQWPEFCTRYQLENFRAALDAPGEWYLDQAKGKLLYIPRPGETLSATVAEAPVVDKWLDIAGDRAKGTLVKDVSFRGITFTKTGCTLPQALFTRQGEFNVGAAVCANGAENLFFEGCRFESTADYGVWLAKGVRHARIVRCRFDDLGAGGVRIGDRAFTADEQEDPSRLTGFVTVENNIIANGGRQFSAGMGVVVLHAADCRIAQNEICNLYYTGVSVGWTWGFAPTVTRRIDVLRNHIHHLGLGVHGDMGGIYTLGDIEGSRFVGNHIHDVISYDMTGGGSCGLYTDEGSHRGYFASNVVWRINTEGINQHYGTENVFEGNVVVEPMNEERGWAVTVHRVNPPLAAVFSNNVFYVRGKHPTFRRGAGREDEWSDVVRVGNVERPIGEFIPPPLDGVGVFGDADWVSEAKSIEPAKMVDPPMPPRYGGLRKFSTGFESFGVNAYLPDAFRRQSTADDAGHMRVTDRQAFAGKRSLCLFDDPKLKYGHCPHFCRSGLGATNGTIVISFALRLEPGVRVLLEGRDEKPAERAAKGRPYNIVTQLLLADGKVFASADGRSNKAFGDYRPDTWVRCRLEISGLGAQPRCVYTVTDENGKVSRIEGSAFERPAKSLTWFGFLTPGKSGKRWYVDDIGWEMK